ncbi:thiazole tautomerase (transcriptional regulator TenI) [Evansella vedderi]|uniref:Thiazole tautomerase (Transcriptional regulator TenI) n=1 Tax=Evansella vedderi TaxID=38282 RepID=A0ABT9ZS16_9BACI|nr:thiazole tautomerase TenI [Evansella vedderi]MDQ0253999.1 thiazole tautomerase (transcriptional regulator TenI) [Evansella vedderi]
MNNSLEIHVISNGKLSLQQFARRAGSIEPFVDYFHLREKALPARELVEGVRLLKEAGVPLSKIIINDRVDVAAVTGAAGIQLAFHSLEVTQVKMKFPLLKIGKSIHSIEEAQQAEREGANYVLYGHIFPTQSKSGLPARGLDSLREIVQGVNIPVIAIGGIKPDNKDKVMETGATGVAVMSGIIEAEAPLAAIKAYRQKED